MSDAPVSRDTTAGEIHALLGRGTEFTGTLAFTGRVRIDGKLRGEVIGDGTLVVGSEGEVEARVEVTVLIVRGGTVRGAITAREAVEVHAPGRVYGDITAPEVFIEKGVHFEGQCRMTRDGEAAPAVDRPEATAPSHSPARG